MKLNNSPKWLLSGIEKWYFTPYRLTTACPIHLCLWSEILVRCGHRYIPYGPFVILQDAQNFAKSCSNVLFQKILHLQIVLQLELEIFCRLRKKVIYIGPSGWLYYLHEHFKDSASLNVHSTSFYQKGAMGSGWSITLQLITLKCLKVNFNIFSFLVCCSPLLKVKTFNPLQNRKGTCPRTLSRFPKSSVIR